MKSTRRNMSLAAVMLWCWIGLSSVEGVRPESVQRRDISLETLAQGFLNPPAEARPFVRWWWIDNRVEETEIIRQLDLLKDAGMGGVEINPIGYSTPYGYGGPYKTHAEQLIWRSPEWDRVLHTACKGSYERGMIVDLIAGSGWPFGGEFLKPEQRIMRLSTVSREVSGPQVATYAWDSILAQMVRERQYGGRGETRVEFIKLYPKELHSVGQVRDIADRFSEDGTLTVEIPDGEFVVAFGMLEQGYRSVAVGTKGAAGSAMDHFRSDVTRMYLNRLKGVEETWGEPLSTYVRAVFCDSIELAQSNWTTGMLESFKQSMGYDIEPYLPMVLDPEKERLPFTEAFVDELRRARYDWVSHLVSVFLDNFTREYAAFCHENNLLSRYQSYGAPQLVGMAEGYMIPDIPESNNWISSSPHSVKGFSWSQGHGYKIWDKYASAGGRLRGKKIISSEAMTNTSGIFERTLGEIKVADDMNFITGINHSVLHGFNYVPPDVPFPGLIRFGSYFSEYNTWWPYLRLWADYNARLSYVMQNTKPVSEIALIGPTPDIWSRHGLERRPFHLLPEYLHQLWEPIAQLGSTCDYLHETIIQQADVQDGLLKYGPMAYKVLLVVDMQSMQIETAQAIRRLAEAGGKVVFVNQTPSRWPGLRNAKENDQQVKNAIAAAMNAGAQKVSAPDSTETLRQWVTDTLAAAEFALDLQVKHPRDGLYQLRHMADGEDIFFFTNTYQRESSRTRVSFALGTRGLWRWDPETGQRAPYELPYDATGFALDLRPLESVLLVTGKKAAPAHPRQVSRDDVTAYAINTPWTVIFNPAQSEDYFTLDFDTLEDFTKHPDERLASFSGTAFYTTRFALDDLSFNRLDLGWDNDFISEITLNGTFVGVNWYGSKLFDVRPMIKQGENTLVIKYTTTLNNKMKRSKPSGLIGPVRLLADRAR